MIVLLCLSALFPVLMGTDEVKSYDFLHTKDCSDNYAGEYSTSGVYTIITADGPVQVYCDVESGGQNDRGHWTVFLR
ncbi:tenascin-N-like isoform X2 [Cyprinus carpio]|nr:tenascin-N-like isoform X2 [Cyprinus carpio]